MGDDETEKLLNRPKGETLNLKTEGVIQNYEQLTSSTSDIMKRLHHDTKNRAHNDQIQSVYVIEEGLDSKDIKEESLDNFEDDQDTKEESLSFLSHACCGDRDLVFTCASAEDDIKPFSIKEPDPECIGDGIRTASLVNTDDDPLSTTTTTTSKSNNNSNFRFTIGYFSPTANKYKCSLCDIPIALMEDLREHWLTHEWIDRTRCAKYDSEMDEDEIIYDVPTDTCVKKFKWCQCGTSSNSNASSNSKKIHHSGIKMYECSDCSFGTNALSDFNDHLQIHAGIQKYECPQCQFARKRKNYIADHLPVVERFKCSECDFHTHSRPLLKDHVALHLQDLVDNTKINKYKCTKCSYRSKREDYFTFHLLMHSSVYMQQATSDKTRLGQQEHAGSGAESEKEEYVSEVYQSGQTGLNVVVSKTYPVGNSEQNEPVSKTSDEVTTTSLRMLKQTVGKPFPDAKSEVPVSKDIEGEVDRPVSKTDLSAKIGDLNGPVSETYAGAKGEINVLVSKATKDEVNVHVSETYPGAKGEVNVPVSKTYTNDKTEDLDVPVSNIYPNEKTRDITISRAYPRILKLKNRRTYPSSDVPVSKSLRWKNRKTYPPANPNARRYQRVNIAQTIPQPCEPTNIDYEVAPSRVTQDGEATGEAPD